MRKIITLGILLTVFSFTNMNAQDDSSEKEMSTEDKARLSFTFSDADAAAIAQKAVAEMDANNPVAEPTNGYAIRLNRLFAKHASTDGVTLNYKVYLVRDMNAVAFADGSVRVFAGLMNMLDDNQLLAVIGHEIGHVFNHDAKNAVRASYRKEVLIDVAKAKSGTIDALSTTRYGKIGSAMIDSKHGRKQEAGADSFSYDFMKKNGYDVNAVESAFRILQKLREGSDSSFVTRMLDNHPDPGKRADDAKKRAEKDGLYKEYIQQSIVNTAPVTVKTTTKTPVKKTTAKKK